MLLFSNHQPAKQKVKRLLPTAPLLRLRLGISVRGQMRNQLFQPVQVQQMIQAAAVLFPLCQHETKKHKAEYTHLQEVKQPPLFLPVH
jgi:hypothetical protein